MLRRREDLGSLLAASTHETAVPVFKEDAKAAWKLLSKPKRFAVDFDPLERKAIKPCRAQVYIAQWRNPPRPHQRSVQAIPDAGVTQPSGRVVWRQAGQDLIDTGATDRSFLRSSMMIISDWYERENPHPCRVVLDSITRIVR